MSKFQGKIPKLLSLMLQATVIALAIPKLSAWEGIPRILGVVFVIMYVLWLIVEVRMVAKTETSKGHTSLDKGTLELYAFGRAATVISGFLVPSEPLPIGFLLVGLAIFVSSVFLRLWAIRILGDFYSHRVRIVSEHQIIDTGPYGFIRHPSYTGMLFAHVGFAIMFFNWVTAICLVCILLPGIVLRIVVEERALMASLKGYKEYSKSRSRLVPAIW